MNMNAHITQHIWKKRKKHHTPNQTKTNK